MADAITRDVLNKETNARFWAQTHYKEEMARKGTLETGLAMCKHSCTTFLGTIDEVKARLQ